MRAGIRGAIAVVAIVAAAAVWFHWPGPASGASGGSAAEYRAPRTADGKPDLNGIWQALNTANVDLQAHPARPAWSLLPAPPRNGVPGLVRATPVELPDPAVRALGAVGGVPAGEGVVVGGEIPYQPWAVGEEAREREELAEARSRDQVLHARRAPGHLHALPVPDPSGHQQDRHRLRVCRGHAHHPHGHGGRQPEPRRGWAGRAGAGTATRWWSR